ncbi:MAG: DUF3096 domain-containing protein [Candidatus Aenigmatarchaeota archaeon]
MAEKKVEEIMKKYLGFSAPRLVISLLMIVFGVVIIVWPDLVAILIGIYLLISGILALVDELLKGKALKALSK